MRPAGGDGGVGARRGVGLLFAVVAPAGNGVVGAFIYHIILYYIIACLFIIL